MEQTKSPPEAALHPVVFLGAGPGDPELITLKGRRLLDSADLVVYAGSLVNVALLDGITAACHDSAAMDLEAIMQTAGPGLPRRPAGGAPAHRRPGHLRGDPRADAVVGCNSKFPTRWCQGSARPLPPPLPSRKELTVPEVTQTVIFTRQAGRTPGAGTGIAAQSGARPGDHVHLSQRVDDGPGGRGSDLAGGYPATDADCRGRDGPAGRISRFSGEPWPTSLPKSRIRRSKRRR